MKKILTIFAAAVAALTLASCNKDDSVYENNTAMGSEINVTAMMAEDAFTKANDVTNTTTADLKSFKMWIQADQDMVADGTTFNKPVEGGVKYWNDGNVYYWNDKGAYTFVATAVNNAAASISGATVKDGKIKIEGYKIANSFASADLKTKEVADPAGAQPQDDPVLATASGSKASKVTSLVFEHALSRIRLVATYSKDDKVQLNAKLCGWFFDGVGIEGDMAETSSASTRTWTASKTGVVYDNRWKESDAPEMAKYGTVVENKVEKTVETWANVIPGVKVATKLVAKVAFYDGNGKFIQYRYLTATTDAKTLKNKVESYAAGTEYTYNVTIKNNGGDGDTDGDDPDSPLGGIEITSITVTPWGTAEGGTATFSN